MKKKNENSTEEYIGKHKKLYSHANKLVATSSHLHTKAYITAIEEHLLEGDKVNFELLDKDDVREKFKKSMKDFYISGAKKQLKIAKEELDPFERDALMQAYSGVTSEQIDDLVDRYGKDLTHEQFDAAKQRIQQAIQQRLYGVAGSHLRLKDIEGIVKYVGLAGKVDHKVVDLAEAKNLLNEYHRNKTVSDQALTNIIGAYKKKMPGEKKKKAA